MNQKIRKENRPTIEMRAGRWKNDKVCAEKEKNMSLLKDCLKGIAVSGDIDIYMEKWK